MSVSYMTLGRMKMNYDADTVLSDLDRCPHGRHEGDVCAGWRGPGEFDGGCRGGVSKGNPLIPAGAILGTDYSGAFYIRMPMDRRDRTDPKAWYMPRTRIQGFDSYREAVQERVEGGDGW